MFGYYIESQNEYELQWAAKASIAQKIGNTPRTLGAKVYQTETDHGILGY